MKKQFYISKILFLLTACDQNNRTPDSSRVDSVIVISDILQMKSKDEMIEQIKVNDSLIFYSDSLFIDLDINFTEISENDFQSCKQEYSPGCVLDSGHFISGSGLYVKHYCDEICETYLCERNTDRKMLIPSNFDGGISNILLSPACNQLIVYSSYDGPDYGDYYDYRAEIIIFNVTTGIGLKGISPSFQYITKD